MVVGREDGAMEVWEMKEKDGIGVESSLSSSSWEF